MREKVEKGAAYLDQVFPDWINVVDLETLNLESPCDCVCGQLGKNLSISPAFPWGSINYFIPWVNRFAPIHLPQIISSCEPTMNVWLDEHGFACKEESEENYEELTDAWRQFIKERRGIS